MCLVLSKCFLLALHEKNLNNPLKIQGGEGCHWRNIVNYLFLNAEK